MKYIFTILLFISLQSQAQHYFIIPTMVNPQAKAENISKKFYKLSRPTQGNDITTMLFFQIRFKMTEK